MKELITLLTGVLLAVSLTLTGAPNGQAAQKAEKDLIVGRWTDSIKLDPSIVGDVESHRVTSQIFNNLVAFKPDSFEIIPSLATQWKTSPDGKVWTFTLRDGVKFQDGTDFNADAVVFNFERWWDKSNPYHTGGVFTYLPMYFGGFKGEKRCLIQDVKAIDKNHVQITLSNSLGPFLAYLAPPAFGIASPAAIKQYGDKFGEHPVGTGPFTFQEWKPNDTLTLVKNKTYWESGLPKLDKLVFKVIPDNTARLTALQTGEIDLMDGLNPSDVASVTGNSKLQLFKRPVINFGYLAFNVTKPPFDNAKVRQALSRAINKKGLIDSFYNGLALPAKSALPTTSWAYNDSIQDYQYNLDAAKKLLAEAGYPNGFTTDLWTMTSAMAYMQQPQKIAESIQADFAKIGVKANIISFEFATYRKKILNGEAPMGIWGLSGAVDPDIYLSYFISKDSANPPNATNISLYKSDKVYDFLVKARSTLDRKGRTKLYQEIQQIIHDDAPIVPLVNSIPVLAGATYVKNFIPNPQVYDRYANVDIQK